MTHTCEYDFYLDGPCGRPARLRLLDLWMCADHYDATLEHWRAMGPATEKLLRQKAGLD